MSSTYLLTPREYAAVSLLPGPQRYRHFVGRSADGACVWGLKDPSGWVSLADGVGRPGFPVWPHPDYANACAVGPWAGLAPAAIDLHEFVERWLPDMAELSVLVSVFPTLQMSGVMVHALQLAQDLRTELAAAGTVPAPLQASFQFHPHT